MPFAHVALPLPVRQTFAYRIPEPLASRVRPGAQVQVPFHARTRRGIVLDVDGTAPGHDLKDVMSVLDDAPLSPHLLALGRRAAGYYLAPIREVLRAAPPAAP